MALLRSGWLWRQTSVLKRWKLNWCDLWIDGSLCFYKTDSRRELEHRVSLKTACVDVRSGLECGGAFISQGVRDHFTEPDAPYSANSVPSPYFFIIALSPSYLHKEILALERALRVFTLKWELEFGGEGKTKRKSSLQLVIYDWITNRHETCTNLKATAGVTPPESHPRENLIVAQLKDGSTVNLCANSEDESLAWKLTLLETRRNPVFTYDPYDDSYQAVPINRYHTVYITPGAGPGTHQVVVQRDPFDGVMEQVTLGILAGLAAGAAMRSFLWTPFLFC